MEKGVENVIQALIYVTLSAVSLKSIAGWFEHAGYGVLHYLLSE
jgi:hypothetical protein